MGNAEGYRARRRSDYKGKAIERCSALSSASSRTQWTAFNSGFAAERIKWTSAMESSAGARGVRTLYSPGVFRLTSKVLDVFTNKTSRPDT